MSVEIHAYRHAELTAETASLRRENAELTTRIKSFEEKSSAHDFAEFITVMVALVALATTTAESVYWTVMQSWKAIPWSLVAIVSLLILRRILRGRW